MLERRNRLRDRERLEAPEREGAVAVLSELDRVESRLSFDQALGLLQPTDRDLMRLRYAEDLTQEQVAADSICPKGQLRCGSTGLGKSYGRHWRNRLRTLHDITDPRLVKALAHPLRIRILAILEDRVASPSEIAEQLDAPLGNVSYHVRQLADLGLISLVRETPVRGTLEHHYKAEIRPRITDKAWSAAPDIVKEATVSATLAQIGAGVNRAASDGGFGKENAHLSRIPLVLDEEGWTEVSRELNAMLDRVERIQRATSKRLLKKDHEGELRGELVMMLFETTETPQPSRRRKRRATAKSVDGAKAH